LTIQIVGYLGLVAFTVVIGWEIVTLLNANEGEKTLTEETEVEEVTEVANFWVIVGVTLTIIYLLLLHSHIVAIKLLRLLTIFLNRCSESFSVRESQPYV